MKSLYESTGRINDINTLLVQRRTFEILIEASRKAWEEMCNTAYDEEGYILNPDLAETADSLKEVLNKFPKEIK